MQNETPCQLLKLSGNISKTFMLMPHPKIRGIMGVRAKLMVMDNEGVGALGGH